MPRMTSPEKHITDRIMGMVDGGSLGARDALELTDFCHAQVALARVEERTRARCKDCRKETGGTRQRMP